MSKIYQAGLIGCGDYLRWEIEALTISKNLNVKYTFDLDKTKAEKRAKELSAIVVDSDDRIFNDPEIDIVLIFTPPWVRLPIFEKAVEHHKHIITTKPLAANYSDAQKLYNLVKGKVECAVFYGRSGNSGVEMLKKIFDSGEVGQLALYKEDWFHHYPTWNDWATDPEKNGGPFMDAMIHNLNKSRYLINSDIKSFDFFSDNHAQQLKCNDTEYMKVNFENGAASHLFITWAADLDIYAHDGNDREHYGITHMITDKGWYIEEIEKEGVPYIKAHKEGEVKTWKVEPLAMTHYDDAVFAIENKQTQNSNLEMALEDIRIVCEAMNLAKQI